MRNTVVSFHSQLCYNQYFITVHVYVTDKRQVPDHYNLVVNNGQFFGCMRHHLKTYKHNIC